MDNCYVHICSWSWINPPKPIGLGRPTATQILRPIIKIQFLMCVCLPYNLRILVACSKPSNKPLLPIHINQKTQLQLKTLGVKTIIHTTTKQFIVISNWTKNYNVVFLLFNSFGFINWKNVRILWKVMMCLLGHSLWHESWPTMFQMKVERYIHCVGHFS